MKPIWIGSPIDVRTNNQALQQLQQTNDTQYSNNGEITQVPQERWTQAQQYEHDTWLKYGQGFTSDRNNEHKTNFNNYQDLPTDLGNLLEIGCGPFTQTTTILENRTAQTITLLDPLIEQYQSHPHCTYHNLTPKPQYLPIPAEQLNQTGYNTIVCINVLEHTYNTEQILNNIYKALEPNGIIIFGDKSYDNIDISKIYDIGHPIKINKKTLNEFFEKFKTKYYRENKHYSPEVEDYLGLNHYYIGTK